MGVRKLLIWLCCLRTEIKLFFLKSCELMAINLSYLIKSTQVATVKEGLLFFSLFHLMDKILLMWILKLNLAKGQIINGRICNYCDRLVQGQCLYSVFEFISERSITSSHRLIIGNNSHSINIKTHKCQQIPVGRLLKLSTWMMENV